tara:strand:- start:4850 stop:6886 length:2037 start_codon:yes stop_codon:yes gene_type:complete
MTLFFKQEDEDDDFIPDEIARDLEEDKKLQEDFSEGLDPLEDRTKQTEVEEAAERLKTDMAKKRRRKPARDIRVLNQYLQDMKNIKERGTVEDGVYDTMSRNTFKKISKANINIIIDKLVFLQSRRNLLMEQPYEEFIINGKFRLGEGDSSELVDVKKLQREYAELGADEDFLTFLQGLYTRRFSGEIPPSLIDKPKSRQQLNRLLSSIVIGDPTGGIVRQREIQQDMLNSLNRSMFAFSELMSAKELLTKQIDDLDTLKDADLEILIERRMKALTLAYSTVQRKVAEYVAQRLPDITSDEDRTPLKPFKGVGDTKTPSLEERKKEIENDLSLTYNQFKADGEKRRKEQIKGLDATYERNKKNADDTEKDEEGKTDLDKLTERYNERKEFINTYFSDFTSNNPEEQQGAFSEDAYDKKIKQLKDRLKDINQEIEDAAKVKEQQARTSADIDEQRKKETARLERYKRDAKKRRELRKSDPRRQLVEEAEGAVRVKLGGTARRLTKKQIEDMLEELQSAQPEILQEARKDIQREIEGQLKIEKERLAEIETKLKTVEKYRPLFRNAKGLIGEYTGDQEIFQAQVTLGNKVKLAAQGIKEIDRILRQLNKENEQSLEEWVGNAEKSVSLDLNMYGKVGAGIGDTTPKEVRLIGDLVDRVNTRFDSLQEQINIVKNMLDKRD